MAARPGARTVGAPTVLEETRHVFKVVPSFKKKVQDQNLTKFSSRKKVQGQNLVLAAGTNR